MGLNIKNDHVHELARQAASRTGQTQTRVIEEALERYLAELSSGPSATERRARIEAIIADVDRRMSNEMRARLATDDLYDSDGLPA
ncbi:type II toxin-antitoxin system VapB family antitoxin [Occultella kanbiaonis]|uniref:type II toxin-antitoxin system VapB family antitoxin n=1 Tax=Occultella kanbiaonis TaxID=2675754 RepID=UPI0013D09C8B|nr:type II toxin-antitoxin system VapB family antitoxin [Occultella kanbiaonis]